MTAVLVVDDDPDVLRYTISTLTFGGIPAVGANSAEDALRLLQQRNGQFKMLLTDIVMPRVTGLELASQVAALDPKLPIFFMTGYKEDHKEQFGQALAGRPLLAKPFTTKELLSFVKHALPHK